MKFIKNIPKIFYKKELEIINSLNKLIIFI